MARVERSAGFVIFQRFQTPGHPFKFLLLDYGRHWDFAKGHVDPGESDLDAAVRELREETNLTDMQIVPDFQQEITYFFRSSKHGIVRKTVVFFLAEVRTSSVVLSEEHVGYEFLSFEIAVKRVTFAGARQVLRAAQEHLALAAATSATV